MIFILKYKMIIAIGTGDKLEIRTSHRSGVRIKFPHLHLNIIELLPVDNKLKRTRNEI